MNPTHENALRTELSSAVDRLRAADHVGAMVHLERAHVLGQRFVLPHVRVHWLMFRLEISRGRPRAAVGQLVRIALGAIASALGVLPTGNTGGSDVDMFEKMPIASDLARIMGEGQP